MALVSVIRRWHLREGMPIREIARRTGLSRNTVRKYLADQNAEPSYPARKSPSKLDDYEETLTSWLFRARAAGTVSSVGQLGSCIEIFWVWATPAPTIASQPSPVTGAKSSRRPSWKPRSGPTCRCSSSPAKPSSLTVARTGSRSTASAPSYRSPT